MLTDLPQYITPSEFEHAQPFPHLVIDDLWSEQWLDQIAAEFPDPRDPRWITYPDPKEYGKRCGGPNCWGPETARWIDYARSIEATVALELATGIQPLTADTIGGGMHMTSEGGRLEGHVDFNIHPDHPGLERRLNMLVFLNTDWKPDWGGALYLGADRQVEVQPLFNRTVIFATSNKSWHGHPDPIVGDHLRKSLAVYYYAPTRASTRIPHTTIWQPDAGAKS
jgi:hypothetical protein